MPRQAKPPSNVEAAELFIASLGKLSTREALFAADLRKVAAVVYAEEAGSALSAASRELRRVLAELTPATAAAVAPAAARVRQDAVQKLQDEVAARRRR